MQTQVQEPLKQVTSILISQPETPSTRTLYHVLEKKYAVRIDFRAFIHVEPVAAREFRKQHLNLQDYTCVIFTSRNSIDHFFRICDEMRFKLSEEIKYFCLSEPLARYLQTHVVYRKRKVFFGIKTITDLKTLLLKHRKKEKFLLPCSNLGSKEVVDFLTENNFTHHEAMLYRAVSSDLSDLADIKYDMLVFFSPQELESLFENFPDFLQNDTLIAAFGHTTCKTVMDKGLTLNIPAPTPEAPSMLNAIENHLHHSNVVKV